MLDHTLVVRKFLSDEECNSLIEIYNKITGKKVTFDCEKNERPKREEEYIPLGNHQNNIDQDLPF